MRGDGDGNEDEQDIWSTELLEEEGKPKQSIVVGHSPSVIHI